MPRALILPLSYCQEWQISADVQVEHPVYLVTIPADQYPSFMIKQRFLVTAIAFATIATTYPHLSHAATLKSADVLTWSQDSQSFFFRTSVAMAGLIAARNDKGQSDCSDHWYFTDSTEADREIIATMRKYPDYHPQAVILAMLQKRCGSFAYPKR